MAAENITFYNTATTLRFVLVAVFLRACCLVVVAEDMNIDDVDLVCKHGFELVLPRASEFEMPKGEAKCYQFFHEKTTFKKAAEICEQLNSTLATTKDSATAKGLAHYIVDNDMPTRRYWLGLTDQEKEGSLIWLDNNTPLNSQGFAPWIEREPSSGPGVEPGSKGDRDDCVKMNIWVQVASLTSSARWYDVSCHSREAFICEVAPFKPIAITQNQQTDEDTFVYPTPFEDLGTLINGPTTPTSERIIKDIEVDFMTPRNVSSYEENKNLSDVIAESFFYPWIFISYEKLGNYTSNNINVTQVNGTKNCSLECTSTVIKATCPLSNFLNYRTNELILNDANCGISSNRTHLIVHTTLDGCGTVVKNLQNDEISFQNTLWTTSVNSTETNSTNKELIVLECRYPQIQQLTQNITPVNVKPHNGKDSKGDPPSFPHVFLLYKDGTFDCPFGLDEYPVRIFTTQRLYFEVRLTLPSQNLEIHPYTCVASPDEDIYNPNNYVLVEKGCVQEETFLLESSEDGKISRFSVQASSLVQYYGTVFVHCEMLVCGLNSESSAACPFLCSNRTKREQNNGDAKRFQIMSGAILLADETEEKKEEGSGQEKEKRQQPQNDEPQKDIKTARLFLGKQNSVETNTKKENSGRNSGSRNTQTTLIHLFILLQSAALHCSVGI